MSKKDNNKPPIQLIEPDFIFGIADVLGFGCKKYSKNNWKKPIHDEQDRIFGSIQRHLWSWKKGNVLDDESKRNHLLHAATDIMFLYYKTVTKAKK